MAQQPAPQRLGLIGFGRFGRFAASHLRSYFDLTVADVRDVRADAAPLGVRVGTLQQAASADMVLLAVPVQALRDTLGRLAPLLAPGTLVMDVASVKVAPLRWMRQELPDHVEILGTHPMFGPESAAEGLDGHQVVLCPERTSRTDCVRQFLESLDLQVIVTDPDTHDRQCACTQALAQYLGRALRTLPGKEFAVKTPAAQMLHEVASIVGDDTWELFEAIQTFNPYAESMRRAVRERLAQLDARLTPEGKD